MSIFFKRVCSVLLTCMLSFTLITTVYANEITDDLAIENQVKTYNIDELSDDEFDLGSIMVILKQEYSSPDNKINNSLFSGIENKEYINLSESDNSKTDEFRNIIHVDLKKTGRDEVKKAIDKLSKRKEVYYVGPNLKWEAQLEVIPNDPEIQTTNILKPYKNIQLPEAWNITVGSKDVLVANNEPIQYTHEDLKDNMWINPNPTTSELHGYNFNSPTGDVYPHDGNGHGTLTAGVIGAVGNNGKGVSGVAQEISIMSCMAVGSSQFAQMIDFLNENNVELLNISLGWGNNLDQSIKQSFLNFNGLVTISAGNGSRSSGAQIGYDLDNRPSDAQYAYPASYGKICPNVIAVAAVDNDDNLQGYSNYGVNTVALAAPSQYKTINLNNNYTMGSGTSCAAPVVLGTAALIKSVAPHYGWQEIKKAILDNVDVLPGLSGKVTTGGRLNAYKALKSVTAESGTYYIRNVNSNLYLDVEAPEYSNLIQHSFMGGNNQRFVLENNLLKSVHTNTYVTTGETYESDFKRAVVGSKNNVFFSKNQDGTYCIFKKDGNTLKCLDAYRGSFDTAVVGWYEYKNANNQKWVLEDANQANINQGTYYIINKNSGRYLDLNESTGELIQHGYNGGNNQKWDIIKISNGRYKIKTKSTNYPGYINWTYTTDYYGIVTNTGMDIEIFKNDNGTYKIHMPNYAYCLAIQYGSIDNYSKAFWHPYHNTLNEQWLITPAK